MIIVIKSRYGGWNRTRRRHARLRARGQRRGEKRRRFPKMETPPITPMEIGQMRVNFMSVWISTSKECNSARTVIRKGFPFPRKRLYQAEKSSSFKESVNG